jgi:glycosyltransferase involved in cell wall biosynthesis
MTALTYSLVTPTRDEADNLSRLAESVAAQSVLPRSWIIVDNGSTDPTPALIEKLEARYSWIRSATSPPTADPEPGAPVVRALHAGLAELDGDDVVVVKLDADVSFAPDYFERLLQEFEADPALGIAGGECLELDDGEWHAVHVTSSHVRGAVRAYRRDCLDVVLPLVEGLGWDTVDELQASVHGWRVAVVPGLQFRHHRALGARDGFPWSRAVRQGAAAHYLGYRFWYLAARSLFRARKGPTALGMLWGYAGSAIARRPVHPDEAVRAELRRRQAFVALPTRIREAFGRQSLTSR